MPTDDRLPGDNVISLFGGPRPQAARSESAPRPSRPALHAVLEAPAFEDPRQDVGRRTLGRGTAQQGRRGSGVAHNLTHGMGAASVNLAQLQELLESIMSTLTVAEMTARWDDDVRDSLQNALLEWVQRVDAVELEAHESGARVSLQTQDDFGYYQYALDAFPGRGLE